MILSSLLWKRQILPNKFIVCDRIVQIYLETHMKVTNTDLNMHVIKRFVVSCQTLWVTPCLMFLKMDLKNDFINSEMLDWVLLREIELLSGEKLIPSNHYIIQSVSQFSHSVVSNSLWPHGLQHTRLPYPSPTPGVYPNSCPLSQWRHPTITSSVVPLISRFQMSKHFASGGQNIGVSASTSVLPMNTKDRSPLGWTGWISLQSKGLSRAFSNTTIQKYQFFGTQLSL